MSGEQTALGAARSQCLTFRLGEEEFALEIGRVREILDSPHITAVPRMPHYLRGVINLRGNVVPVVDLKLKFGLERTERAADTCVIITEVGAGDDKLVMGALADSVQEVLELGAGDIEPPPRIGSCLSADLLKGMGRQGERFIMILDIDQVLAAEELAIEKLAGVGAAGQNPAAAAGAPAAAVA